MERHRQFKDEHGEFAGPKLFGGIVAGQGEISWQPRGNFRRGTMSLAGISAEVESGAEQKRSTLTRIAAGGLLFGPVGLVVGGLVKKNKSRVYVTVEFPDGSVIVEDAPIKHEAKAREFVAWLNNASLHYSSKQ